jgi:glucose/arabinose dehydrogenase
VIVAQVRRRWAVAGTVGLLVAMTAACSSSGSREAAPPTTASAPSTTAPTSTTPATAALTAVMPVGEPTDVVTGLDAPWSVAFVGDSALVSERDSGRVLEVLSDGSTREVATIDAEHGGEGGLLGLAVADGQLYAYSTGSDGNRIQRFPLTGSAGSYGLGTPTTVIEGLPAAGIHNGGRLAFGPDGMLYASAGDAGRAEKAQDLDYLGGKILRLTPDGEVPADNPFPGSPVWTLGHRNVQGLAWTADGAMYASEFGQNTWDELNRITRGSNYGWPVVEGIAGREGYVDPLQQWPTSQASPSGLAAVGGTLFMANLRGQVLRAVPVADPSTSTELYDGTYGRLRAVTLAPDGSLWFVTNNTDGRGDPTSGDDRILRVELG